MMDIIPWKEAMWSKKEAMHEILWLSNILKFGFSKVFFEIRVEALFEAGPY